MHKITFYPIGNADCCLIELENEQNLLFDYAHCKDFENDEDLRVNLKELISDKMKDKERDYFDIVSFTHADDDHIHGFSDLFYLDHAKKYQDEGRLKILELWVPAAVFTEEKLTDEAKILQEESRFRLKNKKGIKVFSRPEAINDWFAKEKLKLSDFSNFFIDAGKLLPNYDLTKDNFEVFAHSPFAERTDDILIDRNGCSIVVQCVFRVNGNDTKLFLMADTTYDNLLDIIDITKKHSRNERLEWDIIKLPHHCSYTSLNSEKGKTKTTPQKEIEEFYKNGNEKGCIISTSDPIPTEDTDQPPHFQAANFYKDIVQEKKAEFIVTMEFPKKTKPEPIEIEIKESGSTILKRNLGAVGIISNQTGHRAGAIK